MNLPFIYKLSDTHFSSLVPLYHMSCMDWNVCAACRRKCCRYAMCHDLIGPGMPHYWILCMCTMCHGVIRPCATMWIVWLAWPPYLVGLPRILIGPCMDFFNLASWLGGVLCPPLRLSHSILANRSMTFFRRHMSCPDLSTTQLSRVCGVSCFSVYSESCHTSCVGWTACHVLPPFLCVTYHAHIAHPAMSGLSLGPSGSAMRTLIG